jgi:hypothetical protein
MTTMRRILLDLARAVADETERNENFRTKVEEILHIRRSDGEKTASTESRRAGRRTPAVIDPVELAHQSVAQLRSKLNELDVEQLRDIVAQFGMDPGKLVMKWKSADRIRDRIIELAVSRAQKGNAFRDP